jgi:hypothetical protein
MRKLQACVGHVAGRPVRPASRSLRFGHAEANDFRNYVAILSTSTKFIFDADS